ncbi:uncharacterized protein LOC107314253 [Coturnix japonica]|uniref:uncharacterized protein LOC107314253 n=1 Tax=Coturnix japonica TaxID=93934 RepID=UPI000777C8CE|nr:uncharacterized protein LOC107314253 [Coturnix japonica]
MDFLPSPEVTSETAILDDSADFDQLLTWISQEETPSSNRREDDMEMDSFLTWILEATSALEVPQHNQGLPAVTREGTKENENAQEENHADKLLAELDSCKREGLMQCIAAMGPDVSSSLGSSSNTEHPDSPGASRELSKEPDPESGLLANPLWRQPASPELPEPTPLAAPAPPSPRTAHLMEEARRRQPRVHLTHLELPTPLAAPTPPLPCTARLMEEAQC